MKLAFDHHFSPVIAEQLRVKGHDVVAAIEQGWDRAEDERLLTLCAAEQRALVTNNVPDFTKIVRRWGIQGRSHAGLIFTSDASLPRGKDMIGKYVQLLHDLLSQHPDPDALVNRVRWL